KKTMKEYVMAAIGSIQDLYERRGGITGLPTGFEDFDKMTDGLHKAEMVVIAARPSMGKTAFAMNIAEHIAVDLNKPVAVFSLEIAEISSGLKALAKELELPIVVLAQLNRNPEQRSGDSKGRPRLSDLRESGSIEQDADLVGLLVREEYYADTDEDKEKAQGK